MKRVLIADDDRNILDDYKTVIESLGHSVVAVAHTSEEAIIKAYALKPDVALLDIKMDYRNAGIHASNRIKNKFPQTKVYFLSAYAKDIYNADLLNTQYDGYIDKMNFIDVIARVLQDRDKPVSL